MKVFKKFLAALLAAVMVFALVAFTACDKSKDNDKDKDSTDTTDPSDPGTTPGTTPGNTPGNTPGSTANITADSLLTAIEAAASSFTLSMEYVGGHAVESYRVATLDGEKPATGVNSSSYKETIGANVKADPENGNADVVVTSVKQDDEDSEKVISYYFSRGWNLFAYGVEAEEGADPEEVSDFTGKTLGYIGNPNDMLMGILQGFMGGSGDASMALTEEEEEATLPDVTDYATLALPHVNAFLVKLAEATDTLKTEGGVCTIDVIKAFNKIKTDLLNYAVSCKADTTVESVLTNPTVKKYLTLFTDYIPAETLYGVICGAAESFTEDPDFGEMLPMLGIDETFLAAIAPETGVSTYDYLLALLKNESVKDVANAAMYMLASMQSPALASATPAEETPSIPETFTKTLEKTTLGEILTLAGMGSFDFSTLNDLFDSLPVQISDSGITVTTTYIDEAGSAGDTYISDKTTETQKFTKLEIGFTVTDGKVTAQSVVMEAESTYNSRYTYDPENGYHVNESSDEMTYDISIAYGEVTGLADISSCTVISEEEVWKECSSNAYFDPKDFGYVSDYIALTVTLKVEDGEPVGVEIKDGSTTVPLDGPNFTVTRELVRLEDESNPEAQPETANFNFTYDLHLDGSYDVKFMMYDSSVSDVDPTYSITFSTQTEYYSGTVAKIVAGTPDWTLVTE